MARRTSRPVFFTTPAGVAAQIIGPSRQRWGVLLSAAPGGVENLAYLFGQDPTGLAGGIAMPGGARPLLVSADEYGDWVKGSLHVFAQLGGIAMCVVEITDS